MKRRQDETPSGSTTNDVPISLGKPSLRVRLEAYYSLIAPDVISNQKEWRAKFDQIYQKFGGTHQGEQKLAFKLAKKYGTAVRLLLAESSSSAATTTDPQPKMQRLHSATTSRPTSKGATAATTTGQDGIDNDGDINSSTRHDEQWYALQPSERHSGVIDFLSNNFDPLAALSAPESKVQHINPWISESPLLDTVGKFVIHLPECDPLRRAPRVGVATASSSAGKKRPNLATSESASATNTTTSSKKPKSLSAFAAIAEEYDRGPLSVLHRLQNQRIRVLVRYVNAIRGTVTGVLLAFDRHMNMILRDVEEVYTPRPVTNHNKCNSKDDDDNDDDGHDVASEPESNLDIELKRRRNALHECQVGGSAAPESDASLVVHEWSVRQRTMKQLLLRGDSVVLVYKAETERSTWPKTAKSPTKSRYNRPIETLPDEERVGSPGSLGYVLQRKQRRDEARKKHRNPSGRIGG